MLLKRTVLTALTALADRLRGCASHYPGRRHSGLMSLRATPLATPLVGGRLAVAKGLIMLQLRATPLVRQRRRVYATASHPPDGRT